VNTNRIVAIAATVISLALALLPVVANLDWTSTAGVIAGVLGVLGVTQKWLEGWQKHEARDALVVLPVPPEPDQGDAGKT
jgi:predicted membrane channel-forming protein YqfA (hemolysin III family)